MSAVHDSPMDSTINDADVVMGRLNVALARSQKLINSWIPQKSNVESTSTAQDEEDEDDHIKPMMEAGGIGSKVAYGEEDMPGLALQKQRLSSNEQLLERLLGKKAAQARKKTHEAGKSMSTAKHAAPKPLVSRLKHSRELQSEDDEEGGRSAAFKSRKTRTAGASHTAKQLDTASVKDEEPDDERTDGPIQAVAATRRGPDVERPAKKGNATYLDELLAQKAKKKKKKSESESRVHS